MPSAASLSELVGLSMRALSSSIFGCVSKNREVLSEMRSMSEMYDNKTTEWVPNKGSGGRESGIKWTRSRPKQSGLEDWPNANPLGRKHKGSTGSQLLW